MSNTKAHPLYWIWHGMKKRCHSPRDPSYPNYGGRGIRVCESWRTSFLQFVADVGTRPSAAHSIERIDNDRGYEPGNVRWATVLEQSRNRRTNRILHHDGKSMCVADWATELGMSRWVLKARVKTGWSTERALTQPVRTSPAKPLASGDQQEGTA